jgi:hypothetical protein
VRSIDHAGGPENASLIPSAAISAVLRRKFVI